MRLHLAAAAALACALAALPALPARAEDDWATVKDESETLEILVPPGSAPAASTVPERAVTLTWPTDPWKNLRLEINAYPKQTNLEYLVSFSLNRMKGVAGAGSHDMVEGSKTRFINIPDDPGKKFVYMNDVRLEGTIGYVVTMTVHRDIFENDREPLDRMLDSFKTYSVPKENFTIPPDWKRAHNTYYVVVGPVDAKADAATKDAQERRLSLVGSLWLDDANKPTWQLFRSLFDDRRKIFVRSLLRVFPDAASYRAAAEAAGAAREGARAVYAPSDPDRAVLVDGSPEGGAGQTEVVAEAGVQYVESRTGPLPQWLRSAFRDYWEVSWEKGYLGAANLVLLEKAKDLFRKKPPKFADLRKADAAAFAALGEDGRVAAYAWLYYLTSAKDPEPVSRTEFRAFLAKAVGASDLDKVWKETHAREDPKKSDAEIAKWLKDFKIEKKK